MTFVDHALPSIVASPVLWSAPRIKSQSVPNRAQVARALRDNNANAMRTITRRVKVKTTEDYANTPARRYINFTGFPFPIGPIAYRKTTCREVCSLPDALFIPPRQNIQ
jgi:hypothetical protein